jgi:hypothetical protein
VLANNIGVGKIRAVSPYVFAIRYICGPKWASLRSQDAVD